MSVDDAAALRSQLWRFRRAVALPDHAGGYPQGMRRWSGGGQILHLIEDERDGVRHADLIRATSSCRPRNSYYGKSSAEPGSILRRWPVLAGRLPGQVTEVPAPLVERQIAAVVSAELVEHIVQSSVPEARRVVVACGGEGLAVRAERHCSDLLGHGNDSDTEGTHQRKLMQEPPLASAGVH